MKSTGLWLVRVGYALLVVAVLLLVGAGDLLPVDLWLWFHLIWSGVNVSYIRAVPGPEFQVVEWLLVIIALAAIAAGSFLRSRGGQR